MEVSSTITQAVDGPGLLAAGLRHALGRPPGGGGQGGLQAQGVKQGQHPPQGGGLAGARPAGEQHHLAAGGQLHRAALLAGVHNALPGLDAVNEPVQPLGGQHLPLAHLAQPHGHIALRLIQPRGIAGGDPGDVLPDHLSPLHQLLQPLFQAVPLHADQRGGGGQQFVLGQEHMAVVRVVLQFK